VTGPTRVDQRAALERLHTRYDMKHHGRAGSEQTSALPDEFVDDYAVVGPADSCIARLREVQQLGIGKVYVIGASFGSRPEEALESSAEMVDAVLPAFRVDGPVREPLA
jgi:5,10-methylenetetrahydromethanopterin reductase